MYDPPEEPYVAELTGEDAMNFPPSPGHPPEDRSVIPPTVIDEILDAFDDVAMASVPEVS